MRTVETSFNGGIISMIEINMFYVGCPRILCPFTMGSVLPYMLL